ncbi:MAG: DUF1501 domain-containing protein [Myxococcales bacterium]|nr:DUF1501 domain-containing protein [Myxococcales bacterium]
MSLPLTRRTLLAGAATTAAAGLCARRAGAAWGDVPQAHASSMPPAELQVRRALELTMYGGMNAFDTFHCVPAWGQADGTYLHAFDVAARVATCGGPPALTRPFAAGPADLVHLGPWTWPLWSRPDLLARTRVVVLRHDQLPHETAIPLTLTGRRVGRPELAGAGAAIQRHFGERPETARVVPHAAVVQPGDLARVDNYRAALAVGLHPASARPLEVDLAAFHDLDHLLQRPATSDRRAAHDAFLADARARLAARLGPRTPPAWTDFSAAEAARERSDVLSALLPSTLFGLGPATSCDLENLSKPALAARVAAHLLTHPETPLRYVQWIDAGLRQTRDGGHDSHREHLLAASTNYPHTLAHLASIINRPGEGDAGKLDLDDTLVVISSEFGRSPAIQPGLDGLNHWPHAYVAVLIGGPVVAPAVVGRIDPAAGTAVEFATPAELRAAVSVALGVYPFDRGGLDPADIRGASDPGAALRDLSSRLLGVDP